MTALDVGTSKICCLIARTWSTPDWLEVAGDGVQFEVLGFGHHRAEGLKGGMITHLDRAEHCIRSAVDAAERMAGQRIESVVVSLAGGHLNSQNSTARRRPDRPRDRRGRRPPRRGSLPRGQRRLRPPGHPRHPEGLHRLDGQEGVRDAVGMMGHRLEVETNIITADEDRGPERHQVRAWRGLWHRRRRCQRLAAGEGVASLAAEVELGVCLVDIGAGTTAVVVLQRRFRAPPAVLPVGGNHVTSDIAIGLRTTLDEAEKLKLNYGHTLPDVIDHSEKVEVRQVGGDRIQALPRRFLAEIIGPRMIEIFQMAREEACARAASTASCRRAVVVLPVAAPASWVPPTAAQAVFERPVRLGQPLGVDGLADRARVPSFAVAIGLVKLGARARSRGRGEQRLSRRRHRLLLTKQ